jgi:hypothetical protein
MARTGNGKRFFPDLPVSVTSSASRTGDHGFEFISKQGRLCTFYVTVLVCAWACARGDRRRRQGVMAGVPKNLAFGVTSERARNA